MHLNKNNENKKTSIINLGCRLNGYESSVIDGILKDANIENDCIVINTCAVTAEAERKSRQIIRKLKKQNPNKKIIVTGCAAQINPKQFTEMEEVDKVIGNGLKTDKIVYQEIANEWSNPLILNTEKAIVNDIMSIKDTANHLLPDIQNRSRAFLQIQNGCNHRCTFCIIPYGRGNSRSVPVAQIINNINDLIKFGYNEVVLTGVDITDYGIDLPGSPRLGNLCKRILSSTNLKRLRLSSIDVAEIDEDLYDIIKTESRFMSYFHISLQSGDNLILKRMKRRHTREDVIKFCENIRKYRSDAGFGADIICGFPTESDEMFESTIKLVKECKINYIHAFTYSARSGTPAAKMPQVLMQIRKERTNKLIQVGDENLAEFLQLLSKTKQSVLLEADMTTRAENFAKIHIENKNSLLKYQIGDIISVQCVSAEKDFLIANVI